MTADALVTAGVLVTGIAMVLTGFGWIDPAVSLLVSAVIVYGTWGLMRDATGWRSTRYPAASTPRRCAPISPRCRGWRRSTTCTSGA